MTHPDSLEVHVDIAEQFPVVSPHSTEDARELFRRVAVSVGVNNTDDHLRNHGFLRRRGGWALSPAFDINPHPDSKARQTSIAGSDDVGTAADGLRELAGACRLSADHMRDELRRVEDALRTWREIATRNGVTRPALSRFQDAFGAGLDAVQSASRTVPR